MVTASPYAGTERLVLATVHHFPVQQTDYWLVYPIGPISNYLWTRGLVWGHVLPHLS
jgi:hypothetical protein